ncbi:hypothetical protein DFH11DRAFT_1465401, partial [Phellopilus nigrolimitatus]
DDDRPGFVIGSTPSTELGSGKRMTRGKIEVACDFCRKRKMRCDGARPSCRNCARKNEACIYTDEIRRR